MTRDEAKAKIAKLMALGTHETTNENEAEAALRQAAFLMRKHAIEQAELADATGAAATFEWATVHIPLDPARPVTGTIGWLGSLAVGIAEFTDTKASYSLKVPYGMCMTFQGEAVDVEYAAYLAKHLRDTIRRMSAEYKGRRADRELFRAGMVSRLRERMREYTAQRRADLQATPTATGTAIAIVNRKLAERDSLFGKMKVVKKRRTTSGSAFALDCGRAAGDKVGFGRPLAATGARRALAH